MTTNENEMSFLQQFSITSSKEVIEKAQTLINEKHLKDPIIDETIHVATQIAKSLSVEECRSPRPYHKIAIPSDSSRTDSLEYIKFQLVLDFLQSIGCKFAPGVFQKESQNPSIFVERKEIAEKLCLREYDKTPLLVQLIEAIRTSE